MLRSGVVTLRELRVADAGSLLKHLAAPSVCSYITPAPASADGFKRFIHWTRAQRRQGTHFCFGIVPTGHTHAVGVLQIWPIEADFSTAEWGFALGEGFWGTGLFVEAARLMLGFAFDDLGVFRLEARAVIANGRGNGVLRKLGATAEGTLRGAFRSGPLMGDQMMWSILAGEWKKRRQSLSLVN